MNLQQMTDTLRDSATVSEDLMGAAEAVLVSSVGRVACWLTPLPSAVLVSRAAGSVFDLDGWWSTVIAVVLELVGLVTSNLWLTAKEWNSTKRKSDPSANERLALGLMISYFVTAFLLLLAVELPAVLDTGDLTGLTALLFPGLSAVGVIALNERVTHYRRVAEIEAAKAARNRNRKPAQKAERIPEPVPARAAHYAETSATTRDRAQAILAERPGISGSELGRQLGRSERLGRKLKAELLPELEMVISGNGKQQAN